MSALEDLAAVRTAIELFNNSELKTEVLSAPGSGYDNYKKCRWVNNYHVKILEWKKTLQKKTTKTLESLGVIKQLWEKVTEIVILIATRIVMWAEYHEGTLGLSRGFNTKFFNSSFLTSQGFMDNKKAAEELMKDNSLSIKQKYTLACLNCSTERIQDLYRQMTLEDKQEFYDERLGRIKQTEIVQFWSYYLVGQIDQLREEKAADEYLLETAVASGSKAAVEYCLEKTSLSRKEDAVIDAALETVRKKRKAIKIAKWYERRSYRGSMCSTYKSFIPRDNFVDILCFLLSKMREDQQVECLKRDIEDSVSGMPPYVNTGYSRVLKYLLNWPYQNYFMKTAQLMWDFLPERSYAKLLCKIGSKIYPSDDFLYDDESTYTKLFREFWRQSPDRYKRYVFCGQESSDSIYPRIFLCNLFQNFPDENLYGKDVAYEYLWHIELILDRATDEEKKSIISSDGGRNICIGLMEKEKWKILEGFISKCLPSKDKAGDFKRGLIFTDVAQFVCMDFIKGDNWDAAEAFIRFSSLSEEEITRLKRDMIHSEIGKHVCLQIIEYDHKIKAVDRLIRWCLPSEEDFKRELLGTDGICKLVMRLLVADQLDLINELFNWGLSSQEEVRKVKKNMAYTEGCSVFEQLISDDTIDIYYSEDSYEIFGAGSLYEGRKWECVEELLTWCFSSEEEIRKFKKDWILRVSGKAIHFNLIKSNQWEEARLFFAWLGLSPEEVNELKRETLFEHEEAHTLLRFLMDGRQDNEEFSDNGAEQGVASVELLFRWCLTDNETVLEFRDHFKQRFDGGNMTEEDRAVLEEFDSAIEQRLSDLEEEQREERKVGTE